MRVKKELNSYTFSDIEHFAINLLVNNQNGVLLKTDLANEFESAFDEILVDEYQDTNTTQDTLYYMLSNGHNLFMVGDVKQSIYRFRHAMPKIFTEKKNSFDDYNVIDSINRKILLSKNFRSRKEICDYVNHIFSSFMSEEIGELDYNKDEYLFNGADYNEECIINHSDCYDDAKALADLIVEKMPKLKDKIIINYIGTTIGSHTGPGTVALFFWGAKRVD